MSITLIHPALEEQAPPTRRPHGDDATRIAKAVAESHITLVERFPLAMTAGNTYPLVRDVAEYVAAAASEIDHKMTVTELHNLLTTGRR
jgi:hypothetical protein